ncbi:MAG: FAD:protein FMN transferase [Clostridiales bacterium]|nr:FAD:protein FMN transferase [Clostridiales bacterium]
MKNIFKPLIPLVAVTLLTSCASTPVTVDATLFAMDTILSVRINDADTAQWSDSSLESSCKSVVEPLEATLSATIESSDVSLFNRSTDGCEITETTAALIDIARRVNAASDGAFDVTVRPLVELWDIAQNDLAEGEEWTPPTDGEIASLLPLVGMEKIASDGSRLSKSAGAVQIDLGGIGKGWAVGALTTELNVNVGQSYGTLSFGGNIATIGSKPTGSFSVGVKNPYSPNELAAVLNIPSGIVAVSGGYERYVEYEGEYYHHIISPIIGRPSKSDLASVAVWIDALTPEAGALADALSTAIFICGSERAQSIIDSFPEYKIGVLLITTESEQIAVGALAESKPHESTIREYFAN